MRDLSIRLSRVRGKDQTKGVPARVPPQGRAYPVQSKRSTFVFSSSAEAGHVSVRRPPSCGSAVSSVSAASPDFSVIRAPPPQSRALPGVPIDDASGTRRALRNCTGAAPLRNRDDTSVPGRSEGRHPGVRRHRRPSTDPGRRRSSRPVGSR